MTRILIADDNAEIRELIAVLLRGEGYAVLTAQDGAEAWKLIKEKGIELAVLDYNMPKKNGMELISLIRSDVKTRQMPILMLTVRALVEDQIESYGRGADDYLTKPFENEILLARIKALEKRMLRRG